MADGNVLLDLAGLCTPVSSAPSGRGNRAALLLAATALLLAAGCSASNPAPSEGTTGTSTEATAPSESSEEAASETPEPSASALFSATAELRDEDGYTAIVDISYDRTAAAADPANDPPGFTTVYAGVAGSVTFSNTTPGGRNLELNPDLDLTVYEVFEATRPACAVAERAVDLDAPTSGSYCFIHFARASQFLAPNPTYHLGPGESFSIELQLGRGAAAGSVQTFGGVPETDAESILEDFAMGPDLYAAGLTRALTLGTGISTEYSYEYGSCTIDDQGVRHDIIVSVPAGLACAEPDSIFN